MQGIFAGKGGFMDRMKTYFTILPILLLFSFSFVSQSRAIPPYPSSKGDDSTEEALSEKAAQLFDYAKGENPLLRWDGCLAEKAKDRARKMVKAGYFDHKDPRTGNNPAWKQVASCYEPRYAGENLTKGYSSARKIHESLMKSPTHRRNILNRAYNRLGIGCYEYVCVELFAGV